MEKDTARNLGNTYTIVNSRGDSVDHVQLVTADQILAAANGAYDSEVHGTFANYIKSSAKKIGKRASVDNNRVMWHVNRDPEGICIHELVVSAYTHGFDTVIIEDLSEGMGEDE